MGAALVPLLTTAAGVAINQINTNQTEERTRRALALQMESQDARQREAKALIDANLQRTRAGSPEDERGAAFDEYLTQLRKTQGNAAAGFGQVGAVADRYTTAANDATAELFNTGMRRADQMARIDAPMNQRTAEGLDFSRLNSNLGLVRARSESDRFLDALRLQIAQRRNAAADAISSGLISYGSRGGGAGQGGGAELGEGGFGTGTLLGQQASTGAGSIFNFGNNLDAFRRWRA